MSIELVIILWGIGTFIVGLLVGYLIKGIIDEIMGGKNEAI